MPQPPQQPAMRAPSMTERVTGGLQSAYDVLSENPLVGLIRKLGVLPDQLFPPEAPKTDDIRDPANWKMGILPFSPGTVPAFGALRGARAAFARPTPGTPWYEAIDEGGAVLGKGLTPGVASAEAGTLTPTTLSRVWQDLQGFERTQPLPHPGTIPGSTIDEILEAGERMFPAARSMQVIEPGTGAVLNPARDQAVAYARKLAGK